MSSHGCSGSCSYARGSLPAPHGGTPAGVSTVGTPPARQQLGQFVAQHQRARIVLALAEEIVEHGYRDVTVTGIVKRAGVARNTFYGNFANKEECFLAASDLAGQEAMRHVADAVERYSSARVGRAGPRGGRRLPRLRGED